MQLCSWLRITKQHTVTAERLLWERKWKNMGCPQLKLVVRFSECCAVSNKEWDRCA